MNLSYFSYFYYFLRVADKTRCLFRLSPCFSSVVRNHIVARVHTAKDLKAVKEYRESVEDKLPKDAALTSFFLSWNDELKPYVLKKLDKLIEKEAKTSKPAVTEGQ